MSEPHDRGAARGRARDERAERGVPRTGAVRVRIRGEAAEGRADLHAAPRPPDDRHREAEVVPRIEGRRVLDADLQGQRFLRAAPAILTREPFDDEWFFIEFVQPDYESGKGGPGGTQVVPNPGESLDCSKQ